MYNCVIACLRIHIALRMHACCSVYYACFALYIMRVYYAVNWPLHFYRDTMSVDVKLGLATHKKGNNSDVDNAPRSACIFPKGALQRLWYPRVGGGRLWRGNLCGSRVFLQSLDRRRHYSSRKCGFPHANWLRMAARGSLMSSVVFPGFGTKLYMSLSPLCA